MKKLKKASELNFVQSERNYSTINDLLEMAVAQYSNRVFAVLDGYPFSITFTELGAEVEKQRKFYASKTGLIAFYLPNSIPWIVHFLAVVCNGQTAVAVDSQTTVEFVLKELADSRPSIIVTTTEAAQKIKIAWNSEELGCSLPEFVLINITNFSQEKKEYIREPLPEATPNSVAVIMYSSGSTGKPKGVVITHGAIVASFFETIPRLHPGYLSCGLAIAPFSHISGISGLLMPGMFFGIKLIFIDSLHPHKIISAIKQHGAQGATASPVFLESFYRKIMLAISGLNIVKKTVVNVLRFFTLSISYLSPDIGHALGRKLFKSLHEIVGGSFAIFISIGARLQTNVIRGLYSLGYHVYNIYGLTETAGPVSINNETIRHPKSVGKPLKNIEVKIVNPDAHGVGEVFIKTHHLMKEYYKNKEQTDLCIQNGWFRSGDFGYLDRSNYLYILGRGKEVIKTGDGRKIYPDDLEEFFAGTPFIEKICAFGVQVNEKECVAICAQISPEQVKEKDKIKEILAEKNSHLPLYMRANFIFVEHEPLPLLKSRKVNKIEVTQKYEKILKDKS